MLKFQQNYLRMRSILLVVTAHRIFTNKILPKTNSDKDGFALLACIHIRFPDFCCSITAGANSTVYMPFNPDDYDDLYSYVRYHTLYFCLIGIGMIVFGFIQLLCWDVSQERQMRTIREKFFKAVVHSDIAWFDLHNGAELGTSFNE